MMSLTFGLFTQVSGSGPLGPLVLKDVSVTPIFKILVRTLITVFTLLRLETCFEDMIANSADPVLMQQNAASDQGLHYLLTGFWKCNKNEKHTLKAPKTRNGLIQIIKMDWSTGQERVYQACQIHCLVAQGK